MITFKCDLCGGEAIVRSTKASYADFSFMGSSPTLPEIVYEGIRFVFWAQKSPKEINADAPSYMKRDNETADICIECLIRALTLGRETTREDVESAVTP